MNYWFVLSCICQEIFQSSHGGYWWPTISNQFIILQISSNQNSQLEFISTSIIFYISFVNIHAWSHRLIFLWVFNEKIRIVEYILNLLQIFLQPGFLYVIWQFCHFSKVSRFWNEMGNLWTRFSQRWQLFLNIFFNIPNYLV